MKNLDKSMNSNVKYFWILLTIILAVGLLAGIIKVNDWFNRHFLVFSVPLKVNFILPISIKTREPQIIEKKLVLATPEQVDTPIKQYACEKWGEFECLTMIAIFQGESGWDNNNWHYNDNGTLDWGIGMINSVNWGIPGCSIQEIVIPSKNIDCSYIIWDRADGKGGDSKGSWQPWIVWQTGAFLGHL